MRRCRPFRTAILAVVGSLAGSVAVGLPPATAGAAVLTVPAGVAADCSVNVTPALQAWIDAAPDGSTLQFAPGACYRTDGTLLVKARVGLTLDGRGATFKQVTNGSELVNPSLVRSRSVWALQQNRDITMRDIVVIGANPYAGRGNLAYQPKYEAQHAYLVQNNVNTLLDRVQAYDTFGDFVYVGPGTNGLLVRNSTFSRNGRQGWTINGSNITFDHNTISETRRATIDIEPSLPTWATNNVTISNNVIGKGRLLFLANVGAAKAPIDGVDIINNRLVGKALQIHVDGAPGMRRNYRIIGNTSDAGVSGYGSSISLRKVTNVEVRDNFQNVQASHRLHGVGLFRTSHVVITGNRWPHAKGVWIDRGGNVDVRQSGNWIGAPGVPLVAAAPSVTVGPTPPLATR
jgi:hypothetical protein